MSGDYRGVIVPPPPPSMIPVKPKNFTDPLEIVLGAAQACWSRAQKPDGTVDLEIATRAAMIAKEALPYLHARKSAGDSGDPDSAERRASIERAEAGAVRSRIEDLARRVRKTVDA